MKRSRVYGTMAEFDSAQALVDAAHRTHEAGYQKIDAYSPFPIEGLAEAIGFHKNARTPGGADRRTNRRFVRIRAAVLDFRDQLSSQRRAESLIIRGPHSLSSPSR